MRGTLTTLTTMAAMALTLGACNGSGTAKGEAAEPAAPTVAAEQVRSYPHDPAAFTQGLVFHDGQLYESTGRYGESSLRRVRLETGEVLEKVAVPERHFAEGLALLGGRLYQLTWQDGMGFIYDVGTLRQQGTFPYEGEGWGLTTDGTSLILSDGSNVLRFLDPATAAVTRTVEVTDGGQPVHQLNELEWVRGEVWANVWHDRRVARIDPETGRVKAWLDLSGLVPTPQPTDNEAVLNGIAYDPAADRLFVTGKLWPTLFEIRAPGVGGGANAGR
ncbi:MAG TPA: glutaminyl-peptide cyclotransferase [Longimicrobium sp.]